MFNSLIFPTSDRKYSPGHISVPYALTANLKLQACASLLTFIRHILGKCIIHPAILNQTLCSVFVAHRLAAERASYHTLYYHHRVHKEDMVCPTCVCDFVHNPRLGILADP